MRRRYCARDSRRSAPCETRQRRPVILSLFSVSAAWVIWVCNMPGAWGSRSRRLPVAPTRRNWRRSSAPTTTSTTRLPALQELGGAKVILITASGGKTVAETFKGLRPGGVSIVLGVGPEPIEVSAMDLIFGNRKLEGALTGDPATGDETLRFSALSGVSAITAAAASRKDRNR